MPQRAHPTLAEIRLGHGWQADVMVLSSTKSPVTLAPQLYVGSMPTEAQFRPIENEWHKPRGGLWTSTYDPRLGSDWVQWCLSEEFGVPEAGWQSWVLTPTNDARVLTIDSLVDLELVCRDYLAKPEHLGSMCPLDYERLAEEYDAVHLTEQGQWRTRLSLHHSLYGWDCESSLWLRWAFSDVQSLGRQSFDRDKDG
jgi:hypothetical protein